MYNVLVSLKELLCPSEENDTSKNLFTDTGRSSTCWQDQVSSLKDWSSLSGTLERVTPSKKQLLLTEVVFGQMRIKR